MKSDLKRIEATLRHLEVITGSCSQPTARQNRSYSFEVGSTTQKRTLQVPVGKIVPADELERLTPQGNIHQEPTLPKLHSRVNSVRSSFNPSWKTNKLNRPDPATCKAELGKIVCQIKDLYLEGPIVDGWLESHQYTPDSGDGSYEPIAYSMSYVEAYIEPGKVTCESPRAGYRLCGFDAAGVKWVRPCPLEQLPSVSMAIARYQKLKQLLERKRYLETCLNQNNE